MEKLKENRKKNKQKKLLLLLILVLTISVGYAALATTIKINGTSTVKGQNWSVYWDHIVPTEGSVTGDNVTTAPTTSGTDTTEVEFAVTLPEPGDFYEFEIDAVNAGTIDAMIASNGILKKAYSDANYTQEVTLPDVVRYTVTYSDGTEIEPNHLLAKKSGNTPTKETYKVRVEYRNDSEINPSDLDSENDRQYYFKFAVEYVQADSNAVESHPSAITYITRQVEGQITPGDVIGIGETEDFYVISSDATKTVLFAKYNLLVGNVSHYSSSVSPISPSVVGYGLQSVDAVGGYCRESGSGTVAFSNSIYWIEENNLKAKYNENDTIYWDSSNYVFKYRSDDSTAYPYVYDENSNIYQYISGEDGYVNKLISMGAPNTITGRLLSYEEAENTEYSIMANDQDYWFGNATFYNNVYGINAGTTTDYKGNDAGGTYGVRPVIEIPTSEIK